MISKYAIVENGIVTGAMYWDGRGSDQPWAGAILVPLNGSEFVIGAKWDGQQFTLDAPVRIRDGG